MKFLILAILLAANVAPAAIVPGGTEIQIRLTSSASSDKPSGEPVSAVVVVPVFVAGAPVIAAGTRLSGNTADANPFRAASSDTSEQPATLRIQFTRIYDPAGRAHPLYSVVRSVDNARESIDNTGLITGILASDTLDAQIDKGISKLESRFQQFADILAGVKGALLKPVDTSIDYAPGVELSLALTRPLEWNATAQPNLPGSILPANALTSLVVEQPFRTTAQNPPAPSDLTNLMFIATEEQLTSAFHEAGWLPAEALSRYSKFETARAVIQNRGYREAPVSILYLDGRPPDLTFQKQNDTFAMRHHIRIWLRPQTFHDKPVWVAAATHDISITFSQVSQSFTHGIDPKIDGERAKVVNDLLFTGYVHNLALVERTAIPRDATNATGDRLITDGKIAVLEF